jgi:hypothetical protein
MMFHEPTCEVVSVSINSGKRIEAYLWLSVLEDVEATHDNVRSTKQMTQLDVNVPVNPGPVLVTVSDWSLGELPDTVQPCLTIVKTDLNTLYFVTTSIIGVAGNAIRMALFDIR